MITTCKRCFRPLATQDDFNTIPEGKGEHLCWSAWRVDCEDRRDAEIARLRADAARLAEALQSLVDEQNGPPLERHAAEWYAAMQEASAALAAHDAGAPADGVWLTREEAERIVDHLSYRSDVESRDVCTVLLRKARGGGK